MKKVFWIGIAGALGAIARVSIGSLFFSGTGFPIATWLVNVLGTFLLCLLTAGIEKKIKINLDFQEIVAIGFLGSFTTFSAFSMETVHLFENGQFAIAFFYITSSIIGGLAAASFGFHLGGKRWDDELA